VPGALPSSTHVVLTQHIEGVHIQAFKQLLEKRFDHVINLEYLERLAQSHNEREELSQPEFSAQSRSYRKRI
jgi:archaellum component FlaD/FlaE